MAVLANMFTGCNYARKREGALIVMKTKLSRTILNSVEPTSRPKLKRAGHL